MNDTELQYYKSLNYKVEVYLDPEEGRWFASVPDLGDVLADGATAEEAVKNVLAFKDEVIETDYKRGLPIPKPRKEIEHSGKFLLRVPKSLHQDLAEEADREGTSINRLAIQILSADLERRRTARTVNDSITSSLDALKECVRDCQQISSAAQHQLKAVAQNPVTIGTRVAAITVLRSQQVDRNKDLRTHVSAYPDPWALLSGEQENYGLWRRQKRLTFLEKDEEERV